MAYMETVVGMAGMALLAETAVQWCQVLALSVLVDLGLLC